MNEDTCLIMPEYSEYVTEPHLTSDTKLITLIASRSNEDCIRDNLVEYNGIRGLINNLPDSNLDKTTRLRIEAALELGRRYLEAEVRDKPFLSDPEKTKTYIRSWLSRIPYEVFACLFLDNEYRLISNEILFTGTIDCASIYPREVVKRCLELDAAFCCAAHSHPSGVCQPSQADYQITLKLSKALALVNVSLIDHLVTGEVSVTSMAEKGMM